MGLGTVANGGGTGVTVDGAMLVEADNLGGKFRLRLIPCVLIDCVDWGWVKVGCPGIVIDDLPGRDGICI